MQYNSPQFETYLQLLLKWNKTYNLTAIDEPESIRIKHFEDSLSPLPFLPTPCRLLDIGSGAGFPGIPLKIVRPDLEIVLLDSNRKKISFCNAAILELKLNNIQAIQSRVEDTDLVAKLGPFDIVITRATFSISQFLKWGEPFLKDTGLAIAMKGPDWQKELVEESEWKLQTVFDYELSNNFGKRNLLIFKPIKNRH